METSKLLNNHKCPFKPGFSIKFDNVSIDLNAVKAPPQWTGKHLKKY